MTGRRLHRRFGTRTLFQSRGPGRYVALTPLGVPLTRDGGRQVLIERRRSDKTRSLHAGWYAIGPPDWSDRRAYETAREAAQRLHLAIREHDRSVGGLAPP